MRSFDDILAIAAERKGSEAALFDGMTPPKTADELANVPDKDWLARMARGIFQAGISWKVVDAKWPGIEEAFWGFDTGRVALMSDEEFDSLVTDTRVIRSGPKIAAIRDNAAWINEVAREHGSFGRKVGDWPADDFIGLLDWMQTNGSRLGGGTGSYLLRFSGKESFVLSKDVVARLIAEGVIDKPPTSKKARAAVQAAFNTWADQSGRSLTEISRVLAQSIDA